GGGRPDRDLDVKFRYEDSTHGNENNVYDDDTTPVPDPEVRGLGRPCGSFPINPIYIFRGDVINPMPESNLYPSECLRFRTLTGSEYYNIVVPITTFIRTYRTRVWWSSGSVHDINSPHFLNLTGISESGGMRTYTFSINGTWDAIRAQYDDPAGGEDYKLQILLSNSPATNNEPICAFNSETLTPSDDPLQIGSSYQLSTVVNVTHTSTNSAIVTSFAKVGSNLVIQGVNFSSNQEPPGPRIWVYIRYKTITAGPYYEYQGFHTIAVGSPQSLTIPESSLMAGFDPYYDFYYIRVGRPSDSIVSVNYSARNPDGTPSSAISLASASVTTASSEGITDATYQNTLTPVSFSPLPVNIHTEVVMRGSSGDTIRCSRVLPVGIDNLSPWYQVSGGNIVSAQGNISSDIPTDPPPGLEFISSDNIGMPIFSGVLAPPSSTSNIGDPGWNADTLYNGHLTATGTSYDYTYFTQKFYPSIDNFPQTSLPPVGYATGRDFFNAVPGELNGIYHVYKQEGSPLTITSGLDLRANGRQDRIIVFVGGDLFIGGKIQIDNGVDFIMFIVSGNISVRPLVGDPAPYANSGTVDAEDIEGIFITNGQFITNDGQLNPPDQIYQLYVRGIVASFYNGGGTNGVEFQRDLGGGNALYPAEIFEFAPDLLLNFPSFFSEKTITWKEVSP
ncbi:MAG: hypothetical protein US62_C0025G0014, partial [Candidatus Woesebacteria bacterium GW2011_GWA1_37_8]